MIEKQSKTMWKISHNLKKIVNIDISDVLNMITMGFTCIHIT